MSEISMYEAQKKKMQGLCDEHDLVYRFEKDRYPIIFTIKPVQGMDAQISMLENVEEVGYRSPDASMSWIFEDGLYHQQDAPHQDRVHSGEDDYLLAAVFFPRCAGKERIAQRPHAGH